GNPSGVRALTGNIQAAVARVHVRVCLPPSAAVGVSRWRHRTPPAARAEGHSGHRQPPGPSSPAGGPHSVVAGAASGPADSASGLSSPPACPGRRLGGRIPEVIQEAKAAIFPHGLQPSHLDEKRGRVPWYGPY